MLIDMKDTSAGDISSALLKSRRNAGTSSGMVLSLIVVTEEKQYDTVYAACLAAGREHPSRILLVVYSRRRKTTLDATIRMGDGVPGEIIVLRLCGELVDHADSVILPLLLPDSPVVAWWPHQSPENPGDDQLGRLADRRITDAMGSPGPLRALEVRAVHHSPGDSDLTWTRLTPWRALLAAAMDQFPAKITAAVVEAAHDNAPANLLAAWLEDRLGVDTARKPSRGPGITAVRLTAAAGDIVVSREDGLMASYSVPGQPRRLVALKRRDINELITEELRRMDADDIFEAATRKLIERNRRTTARKAPAAKPETPAPTRRKAAKKKTAGKRTTATTRSTPGTPPAAPPSEADAQEVTPNERDTQNVPDETPSASTLPAATEPQAAASESVA